MTAATRFMSGVAAARARISSRRSKWPICGGLKQPRKMAMRLVLKELSVGGRLAVLVLVLVVGNRGVGIGGVRCRGHG